MMLLTVKLIGVQSNHSVEYFGGPASPHHCGPIYQLLMSALSTAKLKFSINILAQRGVCIAKFK